MHWIIKAEYIDQYLINLEFNDGKVKEVDFSKFIGGNGVFSPLVNKDYFKNFKIDSCGNTICWENGADICPDVLYDI